MITWSWDDAVPYYRLCRNIAVQHCLRMGDFQHRDDLMQELVLSLVTHPPQYTDPPAINRLLQLRAKGIYNTLTAFSRRTVAILDQLPAHIPLDRPAQLPPKLQRDA
jgi:hypothetical protein